SEFFPKMQRAPGLVGFYLITDEENGINTAINVWESKAHAEAFIPEAASWLQRKRQEWEQRRVMLTKARVSFSFMYMR
ncbi:MAG: hypothetical protein LC769_06010, partial [Chloroflexi bacterium]|nr:hypothetical protein [Chloroflexota bacterium]